jgi:hypothetical protein
MLSLDDVYRKFGEVSEAAQLLETELGTILMQIHAVDSDLFSMERREEAAEIYNSINRSTFGQVLRKIGEKTLHLDHAADLFAKALAERNRLSHSFFRQHNFRRNSPEGRALMLADLDSIHETVLEAYKVSLAVSGIDLDSFQLPGLPTRHLNLD